MQVIARANTFFSSVMSGWDGDISVISSIYFNEFFG